MVTTRAAGLSGLTSGVILMTAHGTPEVTNGALDLGAYEVMDKLFELHAIEPLLPISILAMRPIDEQTHD